MTYRLGATCSYGGPIPFIPFPFYPLYPLFPFYPLPLGEGEEYLKEGHKPLLDTLFIEDRVARGLKR